MARTSGSAAVMGALRRADIVIVPPTVDREAVGTDVLDALRRAHRRGARIVSLCTGAFLLAQAGLIDGRRATTHWSECDEFALLYPEVTVRASTGATPYQWLLRQRIALAQRLLETGDTSIELVASTSGLGTATNLRKHFQRALCTSPPSYRRTFREELAS
jgi:transcriptional regulator GlxA family with amidase domain